MTRLISSRLTPTPSSRTPPHAVSEPIELAGSEAWASQPSSASEPWKASSGTALATTPQPSEAAYATDTIPSITDFVSSIEGSPIPSLREPTTVIGPTQKVRKAVIKPSKKPAPPLLEASDSILSSSLRRWPRSAPRRSEEIRTIGLDRSRAMLAPRASVKSPTASLASLSAAPGALLRRARPRAEPASTAAALVSVPSTRGRYPLLYLACSALRCGGAPTTYKLARLYVVRARTVVFPEPLRVELVEEELREPGRGEVLVESLYSLISTGTELTAYTGGFPAGSAWASYVRYPFKPGYSSVGRIVRVGEGVAALCEGDVVISDAPHTELYVWPADRLVRVPEGVEAAEAAFHTLGGGVMNCVRFAGVRLGESVVVVGAGLLGQLTIQLSRLSGGLPIVAVDLSDYRLELARESGADEVVNARAASAFETVARVTGGRMADVVFEATGDPSAIPQAIRLARRIGRLVVLSSPRGPSILDFHDEVNAPSRIIIGTHFYTLHPEVETLHYPWTWRRDRELFLRMLGTGRVRVKHLISHVISFEETREAYEMLHSRRLECMGVLLKYR